LYDKVEVIKSDGRILIMAFEGKVALVTGAASGIGRATAQRFVNGGAAVVAVDMVEEALNQFATEIQEKGGKVIPFLANVASDSDVEKMLAIAISAYGHLDILCNNAGIMDLMMPAAEASLELWDRVLAVNLTGPFLASRRAIPMMLEQGGGCIINTASEAGLRGGAAGTPYTVSKHGVVGLTKSIAFHYGSLGIRCNAVCPGGVNTAIGLGRGIPSEAGLAKVMAAFSSISAVKPANPDQIAAVITFLASDDASYMNGAIVPVDDGWLAG